MDISNRKKQILKAIISDYIRSAEPIGSKALANEHGLPFSSATIRNEMSELEEMGLLEKPHTSAGRIPSSKGYRLYVNELMDQLEVAPANDAESLQAILQGKVRELDRLIQEAGKIISNVTEYATVATTPSFTQISIKQFEIIPIDLTSFVIVVVTDSSAVKNKMVRTLTPVTKEESELLTYVLNQTLTNIPLSYITAERFDIVRRAAGLTALLAPIAEYIADLIEDFNDQKVYLEGSSKLLRFPEYKDMGKVRTLLDYMENDNKHLLPATRKIDGVQIFIGPENGENPLSDASTIYAKYDIGTFGQGIIGIIGPTRMDYAALSSRLSHFAKGLNQLITATFLEEKE